MQVGRGRVAAVGTHPDNAGLIWPVRGSPLTTEIVGPCWNLPGLGLALAQPSVISYGRHRERAGDVGLSELGFEG